MSELRAARTISDGRGYRPISDYAVIGDTRTAALVSRDGSIDWCCWPRFDSPAVFCRLLDAEKGGWFRVGPAGRHVSSRRYADLTNVLVTTFETDDGRVRVTDFMSVPPKRESSGAEERPGRICRLVEGLSGQVKIEISFKATFDFVRAETSLRPLQQGVLAEGGGESLVLSCPVPFALDPDGEATGYATVKTGDRFWTVLTQRGEESGAAMVDTVEADSELARTLDYWRTWSRLSSYTGPYQDEVRRSALALKLLIYEPTGALIAAPTTSLPEEIGGVRNWDYRYTWLRDSSLVLRTMMALGYHDEAMRFWEWLESLCVQCGGALQNVYTAEGQELGPEKALPHLDGYRGSRPVWIGNDAAGEAQWDIFGEVADAFYFCATSMKSSHAPLMEIAGSLADRAAAHWQEPDHGIWEVRTAPRHFLYSKLLCWVALDRAIKLFERAGLSGRLTQWRRVLNEIRQAILEEGYDQEVGAFTQAFGSRDLDAAALAIPLTGFLPPSDPRVRSTVRKVQEELMSNGLVYRYRTNDGLPGSEANFALCSFWLVENLVLIGQLKEAKALFQNVIGYANDVGLMSEEVDPMSGELLGNFPQGFTHLALISAALRIASAEETGANNRSSVHRFLAGIK